MLTKRIKEENNYEVPLLTLIEEALNLSQCGKIPFPRTTDSEFK